MYKPIQNYQIAELIKERLTTSPVACELMFVQYTGGCSVHWRDKSTVGDTMSTPGDVQYTGRLS